MSKQEDINFLKTQTCVLKVNIHCEGCKQKVKKLLQKIDGVYTISIDSEQGKVTVSGNVDPATLIKKLAKSGKHAELLAPKPNNNHQPQKQQQAAVNGGKPQQQQQLNQHKDSGNKPQKGGAAPPPAAGNGVGKDQRGHQPPSLTPQQLQQLQQLKEFKGLNLPQLKDFKFPFQKDPKTVKFALPPQEEDEGSDFDEYDDDYDDDDDLDDVEGFDADFDQDFKNLKIKPITNSGNGIKGGNAKKVEIPVQSRGNNDAKNGVKKGGGGGEPQDGKKGGGAVNKKNAPNGNGGVGGNKNGGGGSGKKGLGMAPQTGHHKPNPNPNMMIMGQNMGPMGPPNMPAAVHGLPAGVMPSHGYFPGQMARPSPEMMAAAAANPYQQQQYMQAMMQHQQQMQQQRMMMMNGQDPMYQPMMMGYPRLPPQAMYVAPPPPQSEPYTHLFSDENANGCSIM